MPSTSLIHAILTVFVVLVLAGVLFHVGPFVR